MVIFRDWEKASLFPIFDWEACLLVNAFIDPDILPFHPTKFAAG